MKKFTILGAGWLGLALAKELKNKFDLKLSSSNENKIEDLKKEGFENVYYFNENNFENLEELLETDYLFINYPPSKFEDYISFLTKIYKGSLNKPIKKLIFISSTSIYPNEEGLFNEAFEIQNPISKKVFEAESLIDKKENIIFRVSGLMGYNRLAGRYFSGKIIDTEDKKINFVHRDDVIKATLFVLEKDLKGIFNLCAKEHPSSKELYLYNAKKYNFEKPIFKNKKEYKNRIIDGSKIEKFGFEYNYSNPIDFKH